NLTAEQRGHLANFWEAWREELQTVRILDPACGSGAFLIECFDRMAAAYGEATARLADLSGGQLALFDADATILRRNLFGVDISGEAVNICRLSLWIKTAKRDAPLTGLDDNVIQGDSLIDDPAFSARAVDFAARFPQAFEQGGFDVVIGNPPYVRQELIGDAKPFLQKRYRAFHGMADLYVYFYERGLELLRPGGRLSYVVTNKWLKAGYGEGLRGLFADSAWLESVVDFGHAKAIFPDADVFPCVVLARKPEPSAEPPTETRVCAVPRDQLRIDDLTRQTADEGFFLPRDHFGAAPWRLEPPQALALMDKIARAGAPLVEYAGTKPYRGVLTGLNEAFLIDGATRRRLIDQDPACAELIKPYLRGQDVKRWASPASDLFMIVMKSSGDHSWPWAQADNETTAEKLFAATYPSLHRWFKPWEERLRKRQDKGRYWWELRPCAYYEKFEGKMILYKDIMYNSKFSYVYDGAYVNNTVYFIESSDLHILSALSSPLMWWYTWRKFEHAKDEALRFFTDFVQALPIAPCPADARDEMAAAVERLTDIHRRKYAAAADWRDWLRLQHGLEKPGRALAMPFALTGDGVAEQVKAARGARRPLSPSDLKGLKSAVAETVEPVRALLREAEGLERRLSDIVNRAYGLDADDIALLRRTAPPRTPLF
ncbi:MAG TPA: Eco57I restriction-modification methylase domain-containing protein, partial [Azospirillaceae bacterium]|nr:Eco57I restriction-modification methylase domain-containing protein [Azospirillaceae bacterium]